MDSRNIVFRALADPTRRAIFERLCREGEHTVGKLSGLVGVSQPAVSKHIRLLKGAGLVTERRHGRETRCRADMAGLGPLVGWATEMAAFWEGRFDDLERLLRRMDQ